MSTSALGGNITIQNVHQTIQSFVLLFHIANTVVAYSAYPLFSA